MKRFKFIALLATLSFAVTGCSSILPSGGPNSNN